MKEILHNGDNIKEDETTKKLYYKTHGMTDPGQQNTRNYNWNFDKNQHVFGKGFEKEQDGTKKSLQSDFLKQNYPNTIIAKKSLEDFRQANNDLIGTSKFRGTLNTNLPMDYRYGKKSIQGENWNVGKNIEKFIFC
jgi:hypothetical protein